MKYVKKKEKPNLLVPVIVVCFVLVLGLLVWMIAGDPDETGEDPSASGQTSGDTRPSDQTQSDAPGANGNTGQTEVVPLSLPYSLEGGKLTLDAVLQFTGMNPDRQDEWVDNVAAIQLTNHSQEHISYLYITVVTAKGEVASFTAYDIPAGRSALVVCSDNIVIGNNPECAQITVDAVFQSRASMAEDKLLITVDGIDITVKNISGEDLNRITVYCHDMLDNSCYGGILRPYKIDALPAGETAVVSALDCILGVIEVVRIEIGSE